MLAETPYALLIIGAVITGLWLANYFLDQGIPQYMSRKVGHGIGGVGYLLAAFLFSSPWWPLILSGGFTILFVGARLLKPKTFRGVGGSARAHALAECWFPGAATVSLAIGWAWLGDRWLAVVPILFMAWGDMLTGLIRSQVYGREVKGWWGSLGMIVVCLFVAYFFKPYWVAGIGAIVATLVERYTPLSGKIWDDNYTIIFASLLVMLLTRFIFSPRMYSHVDR